MTGPTRPFRHGPGRCIACAVDLPTVEAWDDHQAGHHAADLAARVAQIRLGETRQVGEPLGHHLAPTLRSSR